MEKCSETVKVILDGLKIQPYFISASILVTLPYIFYMVYYYGLSRVRQLKVRRFHIPFLVLLLLLGISSILSQICLLI